LEKENILEWNKDYLKELRNILGTINKVQSNYTYMEFHKEIGLYKKIIDKE